MEEAIALQYAKWPPAPTLVVNQKMEVVFFILYLLFMIFCAGYSCQESSQPLPTFLTSDFEEDESWEAHWDKVIGCQSNQQCGPIAAGHSLQCIGVGSIVYLCIEELSI